jgi:hypothetical protein
VGQTIRNVYTKTDASGKVQAKDPPRLKLNTFVMPSLRGHERLGQTIAPAVIHDIEYEGRASMWIPPEKVTVPICNSEGQLLVSRLGAQLPGNPGYSLMYSNEVDIQQIVRNMVCDAIRALGLRGVLDDHVEIALYGTVRDVIVVRICGRIVFFIQVKCPDIPGGPDNTTVFTSEPVAGQVYSYLMTMLQHGNERPTGALMTYNKMCLVSLKDTKEDAHRKTLLAEAIEKLKVDRHDTICPVDDPTHEPCNLNSSPSRTQEELKNLVQPYVVKNVPKKKQVPDMEENEELEEDQDLTGTVAYSKINEGSEIFPALLQAIQLAYDDSITMQIEVHLPLARHEENLGGRIFLKGDHESTKFVVTKTGLKADAKNFPCAKRSKTFYLLTQLGAGQSSTTYLACNSTDKLCAVNIARRSVASTAPDREVEWNERYKNKEKERNEELVQ